MRTFFVGSAALGFLFFFFLFLAASSANACEALGPRPNETFSSAWQPQETAYQCVNNECGGQIKQKTVEREERTRTFYTNEIDPEQTQCRFWKENFSTSFSEKTHETFVNIGLGKYQACPQSANNAWVSSMPNQCSGSCYPKPEIKKLGDSSLSPKNVFENSKVKLPVNIGVDGKKVEEEIIKESCAIDSYRYEIVGGSSPVTGNIPVASCALSPSQNYSATAQACFGGTCGKKSDSLLFSTSSAPELKSPYDPDWEGNQYAASSLPAILEWCKYPNTTPPTKSFAVNVYETNLDGTKKNGSILQVPGVPGDETLYDDSYSAGHFNDLKKGIAYAWEVAPCADFNTTQCNVFSQLWRLIPGKDLEPPANLSPFSGAFTNMQDSLSWQDVLSASHYAVHIEGSAIDADKQNFFTQTSIFYLKNAWPPLSLNTNYKWKVASCGGARDSTEINDCKDQDGTIPWSEERTFRTTGIAPENLNVSPTQNGKTAIPATLDWNDVPGAASYMWEAGGNTGIATDSETIVANLRQGTAYLWRVKTCANKEGTICGDWATSTFTTATLEKPLITSPLPLQKEFNPYTKISWNKVFSGNFYSYALTFLSPSLAQVALNSPDCKNSFVVTDGSIQENSLTVRFRCLGNYELKVKACIDKECKEASQGAILLLSVEKLLAPIGGLVPCDRGNNDPSTPWDDTEPCQIKHIFLLIKTLIDFALWRLAPIFAMIYTVATGVLLYFSLGDIATIAKIKSIWKAFGIGVLIMLFAWVFLNLLLGLLGFNVTFYGRWYQIPL